VSDASEIFLPDGPGRYLPTELARGPWDPGAQHGGAPAALLAGALEQVPSDVPMAVVRLTYEFLRPVPLSPLTLETCVTRPGGRVQLAEARLSAGEQLVCRAVALRVRRADVPAPPLAVPASDGDARLAAHARPPESAALVMADFAGAPEMFAGDGVEIRFADGAFDDIGPAVAWFRLRVPVVAGEPTTPLQRVAAASDFGNGVSHAVPWTSHLFINPDLTIYLERLPVGEWVGLDASTRVGNAGAGLTDSLLFDAHGRIGRALQGLYVAER
jgi:hypothetical protein